MDDYSLTPKQAIAFEQLKRVIEKCRKDNIYLWDDYGVISAVNGNIVSCVAPDPNLDETLDEDMISCISSQCWNGSNSDDPLYVKRK